ncbi:discoidin domain-containing protein [Labedaea rhizosphaerae]|uniref:Glycosyl hydrolase family 2 n=1 Tax=Labedaea rhizosphaerae TaxID=598644 RepID=A0A4R6SKG8_LABRH|nr:discoidin domain-containing protein [Labedaea rhizosphaerae]TDQ01538.1 glycosyl hydrolase family 2 [Labedaea rhizosphaerae]
MSRFRLIALFALLGLVVLAPPGSAAPQGIRAGGTVAVAGSQGNWRLTVNGQPYTVKGLTWGPPVSEAASRMPDLHAMGVNTIRTWGTDGTSAPLFDAAAANGIRVVAGFWLQPGGGPGSGGCVNYVTDANYKSTMLNEITKWVTAYRDNPGVLLWDVGNESILGMQNCFSGSELEAQRTAYAQFVNQAAQAIHGIDPNHPVTSTDAWTGAWPYLKANAPDLDLYAVNSYGAVCNIKQDWINGGYTKPYIVTEGGPAGEWETPNDANGVPDEPADTAKADAYRHAWSCITGHTGVALGATLFHYGTERDFGGVWFNLIPNNEKRLSYYAVRDIYGGAPAGNTPPVISSMSLGNSTSVPAGGTFTVDAAVRDPDGDPITYTMGLNSKYINGSGGVIAASFTGGGPFTVTAPQMLGVWKLYLYARDGHGNIGIEARSLRVVAPPVQGTNIARGKAATASSYQQQGDGAPYPPSNTVDGNTSTRWASDWSDPQWVQVDLGSSQSFDHVQLVWESAFGKAYQVQVSDNGSDWHDVYSTANGDGGSDDFDVAGTGRYVRVYCTQRGTAWGYSLYEFGVYRR